MHAAPLPSFCFSALTDNGWDLLESPITASPMITPNKIDMGKKPGTAASIEVVVVDVVCVSDVELWIAEVVRVEFVCVWFEVIVCTYSATIVEVEEMIVTL